jgi:hypothetical protein
MHESSPERKKEREKAVPLFIFHIKRSIWRYDLNYIFEEKKTFPLASHIIRDSCLCTMSDIIRYLFHWIFRMTFRFAQKLFQTVTVLDVRSFYLRGAGIWTAGFTSAYTRVYVHACRLIPCPKSWPLLEAVLKPLRATLLNEFCLMHASYEGYEPLVKAGIQIGERYTYIRVHMKISTRPRLRTRNRYYIANLNFRHSRK